MSPHRPPSLRRDVAASALVVTLAVAPPVWAGTIVDARNAHVTATSPARVVTLGAATTETVLALGLGDRIVAADAGSRGLPEAADRATLGYHRQVSAEGVLSMGPDLVLATEASGPPAAIEQIRGAGVPLAVLSDTPTLAAATARIETLGALLDAQPAAETVVQSLHRDLEAAEALRPATPARVLFLYARGGGVGQVAGDHTVADTMIGLAGGTNAFAGTEGYTALTPEAAVGARPDVLLVTTGGLGALGGPTGIWSTPGLAQLPREQVRLVVMDDHLLLGFGPRTGEAALALARHLYSEPAQP